MEHQTEPVDGKQCIFWLKRKYLSTSKSAGKKSPAEKFPKVWQHNAITTIRWIPWANWPLLKLNTPSKKRTTRHEKFLAQLEELIPWQKLKQQLSKGYQKTGPGRPPYPVENMLRIHIMQLAYNLSDPEMEDYLYEVESMRRFAHLRLCESIPDKTTILNFRHYVEAHKCSMLAPSAVLAALPISIFVVGMALCILPADVISKRFDRRTTFLVGTIAGILVGCSLCSPWWTNHFGYFVLPCYLAVPTPQWFYLFVLPRPMACPQHVNRKRCR